MFFENTTEKIDVPFVPQDNDYFKSKKKKKKELRIDET